MLPFPSNPFVFLWRYAMRNKVLFFSICASCVVMVISQKLSPWFFSKMVGLFGENVKFADIADSIWWLLAAVVGTTILAKIMFVLFNLLTEVVLRPRVFEQMSADCFQYINGHSLSYFSDNMAGSLAQKSNALSDAASFYQTSLYYISDVLRLIVVFVMLALVNVSFSLYFVAFMLVSVAVLLKVGKLSMNLRAEMTEAKSKVSGEMIDAMQNHFFVRLFNGYKHEQKRVDKVLQDETDKTNKSVNIEVLQSEGEKIYFHFVYLSFVFYALVLWKDKTITTADVVLIFFLLQDVAAGVSWLIHRTIIYSSIFSEMRTNLIPFSTPHEIVDVENAEILKVKEGIVELKDVCFAYKDNKPLFNHFNLQIPAGQKVGVVGMSGGGKSTLINAILPEQQLKTGEISAYHNKGMHTTTFSEMFPVDEENGYIIDTPGIKGFGTFDMKDEEVGHYFKEIFKFSADCKYNNCTHRHEPGCAVREAVENHYISESRYTSYLNILEDKEEGKYRAAY